MNLINIQEPQKKDLANLLKGISILMRYDCTASKDIYIDNYDFIVFSIETSVDSQDLDVEDLHKLEQLGWKGVDQDYFTEWCYRD